MTVGPRYDLSEFNQHPPRVNLVAVQSRPGFELHTEQSVLRIHLDVLERGARPSAMVLHQFPWQQKPGLFVVLFQWKAMAGNTKELERLSDIHIEDDFARTNFLLYENFEIGIVGRAGESKATLLAIVLPLGWRLVLE